MHSTTNQPPLLREIQTRVARALEKPRAALIVAGAVIALVMAIPLAGALDALLANRQTSIDLSTEASMSELTTQLSQTVNHLAVGILLLVLIVLPLGYGATRMALRVIRAEPCTARDLFAAYLRPVDFSIFCVVLMLSAAIPLIIWMVVALIVAVIVGALSALGSDDPTASIALITTTILVVAVPFVSVAVYWQFRLGYAGVALVDPREARTSALTALATSWKITRRQNSALSWIALYATWALIRSVVHHCGAGLFTRGFPEVIALFSGSYEVLVDRVRAHAHKHP